jgi:HEAT repeat protein
LLAVAILLPRTGASAEQPTRSPVTFQGKPVSFWAKQLQAKDATLRQEAARVLGVIGSEAGEAVTVLIGALEDSDAQVRWRVLEALGSLGRKAEPAAVVLVQFFNDQDAQWRERVVQTVGQIGSRDDRVVLALAGALLDERPRWRTPSAGKILARLGLDAKRALPLLREARKHRDPELRAAVLLPLAAIDRESMSGIVAALDDEEAKVCEAAVAALKELGPRAKPGLPALLERLRKRERPGEVVQILVTVGPEAVPALTKALKDLDVVVGRDVLQVLQLLGPQAKEALPALAETLRHPQLGAAAAEAVAGIGSPAVPILLDAVKDREARKNAFDALGRLGPAAREAIHPLVALLKDADAPTRSDVQSVLARMGKPVLPWVVAELKEVDNEHVPGLIGALSQGAEGTRYTVPALVRLLRESDPRVRIRAAQQLGRMGPLARRAGPALEELRKDDSELVRRAAEDALKQLGRFR